MTPATDDVEFNFIGECICPATTSITTIADSETFRYVLLMTVAIMPL